METRSLILHLHNRVEELQQDIDKAILRKSSNSYLQWLEDTHDTNVRVLLDAIEVYKRQKEGLEFMDASYNTSITGLVC